MDEDRTNPFPILFSPWRIGDIDIPNRIVLSPITTGFGYDGGAPQTSLLEYFRERTSDVGMAVVAFGAVAADGRVEHQIPWMWREDAGRVLSPLAAVIAAGGAVPCLQLGHGGRQVSPRVTGTDPVAPSAVMPEVHVRRPPRELTVGEIGDLVGAFAAGAAKAAAAGFAAVEVHAAHGYLIQQFLSARSNLRRDVYGGETIAARARFGVEVIGAIKEAAPGLAVLVRINGADLVPGGLVVADAIAAGEAFTAAGADALVVSAGVYGSVPYTIPLLDDPEATFVDLASKVRAAIDTPVVAVGRITQPSTAEGALASGHCDAVAVGRALLADPEWAVKARAGRSDEIRPCIGTVEGCAGMLQHGGPISCSVNPDVGREGTYNTSRPGPRRRVVVVGAGPAGLEAARSAAHLGHRVTVVDKNDAPGGSLQLAARTPPLHHLERLVAWFVGELDRLEVDVKLGFNADVASIEALEPDRVIVATGGVTDLPVLDGYDRLPSWTAEAVLSGEASTLGTTLLPRSFVVIGGGRRSLAISLWLAARDRRVVILSGGRAGADTSGLARRAYLSRIENAGGSVQPVAPRRLTESGVVVVIDDHESLIACDGVVIGDPVRARRPDWLDKLGPQATIVGDAREPRGIGPAIAEGRDATRSLA